MKEIHEEANVAFRRLWSRRSEEEKEVIEAILEILENLHSHDLELLRHASRLRAYGRDPQALLRAALEDAVENAG